MKLDMTPPIRAGRRSSCASQSYSCKTLCMNGFPTAGLERRLNDAVEVRWSGMKLHDLVESRRYLLLRDECP